MTENAIPDNNAAPDFLTSDGLLGELIRNYNWSNTPLGPIKNWSQSLKTTVNLMLNSSNPIWIGWGPENTFLYNDAYIDILGIEKHDWALGKPAYIVWEEIWDVCGPLSDRVYYEGKSSNNSDVELFMKRGNFIEEKYFSFSYNPVFDETGKVGGLFCPNFDTTDKILSARRNRTLSELSSKSLIEKTIESACASAAETMSKNPKDIPFAVFYLLDKKNEAAEILQRVGLNDSTEPIFPQQVNLTNESITKEHPVITEVITTGKPSVIHLDSIASLPLGPAQQPVKNAIALPLTLSANKPIGIIIFGINPTRRLDDDYRTFFEMAASQVSTAIQNATAFENERKRLEELAEIDRAKTLFFSNISHEFRTPLTLMLGPLEELMENEALQESERQIVETTHRNAMRLHKLVNTLLDFSLMESGRMKAKFVPTNIAVYTANLAGNFRSVIEKAGMEFKVSVEKNIDITYVDRLMWEKIVFNLLSNAFKYTLSGSVSVSLTQSGNAAVLRVTDTGVGIPKAELPNMFTRFHRIQNAGGRSFEGSGIGLSMIREFVLQHRGDIYVESEEGKGSTFIVKLPIGKDHLPQDQIVNLVDSPSEDLLSGQHIREVDILLQDNVKENIEVAHESVDKNADTVLIVDDNADMRKHLKSIIQKQYNVATATNGAEALKVLKSAKPSLILSDIMMPVMDGITLLKEIKGNPGTATIPVVLLTARAGEESRIEGYETGADDYLVKPFSAKELEARIRSQIRIAKTRDHLRNELKNLFMQAPMAICMLRGENFIVEMANKNILQLWGKDAESMLNRPLIDGLPEAREQGFEELLKNVYTTGREYIDDEAPFYNVNNGVEEHMYVKFIYKPFHEEDGSISGIIVLAHDVTQQVSARKKIEDSEAKFRSLILRAPMGIAVLKGPELIFDMANDAYLTIRGKKREEVSGKPMGEAIPEMKGSHIEAKLLSVYKTGITSSFMDMPATIVINGKKTVRYFNSVYQPLYENDNVAGVIAIVTEVTDQYHIKKLQEKNEKDLRTILETMPHIAFRANPEGNITYFNNKYFTYTGLSFEKVMKMGWLTVIHPDMLDEVKDTWLHSINTGDDYNQTYLLKRADGMYRWHMARTVALKDEQGKITQWVGTLTDIHEQKVFSEKLEAMVNDRTEKLNRANHILAQKNVELEQSNKELESFNYIASHDLQEPLRKIRTFINLIKSKGREANSDLYFAKIDSSAERMSQLINAVLAYSRLSSAGEQFETTDLNVIMQQVLVDFELAIHEKNVIIESDSLPVIKAIPLQMNQLFSNLISNSLKYCTDRPVIKITSRLVNSFDVPEYKDEDNLRQFVELKFIDNGIGFEKQYSEQIFKLFQRLHGKTEYSGTGIGLSICKKIVDQHEGFISAESIPGSGATFTIYLPVS